MKFVIHQPLVEVREYDLPLYPDASDQAVLAMCVGVKPESAQVVETGSAFVHLRGGDEVERAGQRLADARAAEDAAMAAAKQVALAALDAGTKSERGLAEALGVDRNTIRAWRGKTKASA